MGMCVDTNLITSRAAYDVYLKVSLDGLFKANQDTKNGFTVGCPFLSYGNKLILLGVNPNQPWHYLIEVDDDVEEMDEVKSLIDYLDDNYPNISVNDIENIIVQSKTDTARYYGFVGIEEDKYKEFLDPCFATFVKQTKGKLIQIVRGIISEDIEKHDFIPDQDQVMLYV